MIFRRLLGVFRTFNEHFSKLTLQKEFCVNTCSTPCETDADSLRVKQREPDLNYTPQHIANYFLQRGEEDGIPITPLKLIKLVYIAYGWNIALTGKRLFEEPIEAWKHGPVIESLYHEFKHFKNSPIDEWAEDFDFESQEGTIPKVSIADKDTNLILSKVWVAYSRFGAWVLRNKTHEVGSPWHKVYKRGHRGIVLKDSDISEHYLMKIREYLDAAKAKAAG